MIPKKKRLIAILFVLVFLSAIQSKAQTISVIDSYNYAMAVDLGGNVYTANYTTVYKRTSAGVTSVVAGTGIAGFSGDGGPAIAAQIRCLGVAVAGGNVYIVDDQSRIRKINSSGIITTIAGTGTGSFSGDGGPATAADIWTGAIGADAAGNIYLVNSYRIRKINSSGIITTIAGNGSGGYSGDGGPATAAQIDGDLRSVAADPYGNVYISEMTNKRIRKITPAGMITTVAGTGATTFSGDGIPATAANIGWPEGITTDASGNVYISEIGNNRVRKINSAGIISTIAGTGGSGCATSGTAAASADIWAPMSVAVDGSGNIYVESGECDHFYKISGSTAVANDIASEATIKVFPVVNTGAFTISSVVANGDCELAITNMQGQTVLQKEMKVRGGNIEEKVAMPDNLPNGVYVISLIAGSDKMVNKCVLMR